MTTERDRLLTPEEVAAILAVPVRTLSDWRYRHEGPPGFRVGRHVRYRHADVDAWIEEQIRLDEHQAAGVAVLQPKTGGRRR